MALSLAMEVEKYTEEFKSSTKLEAENETLRASLQAASEEKKDVLDQLEKTVEEQEQLTISLGSALEHQERVVSKVLLQKAHLEERQTSFHDSVPIVKTTEDNVLEWKTQVEVAIHAQREAEIQKAELLQKLKAIEASRSQELAKAAEMKSLLNAKRNQLMESKKHCALVRDRQETIERKIQETTSRNRKHQEQILDYKERKEKLEQEIAEAQARFTSTEEQIQVQQASVASNRLELEITWTDLRKELDIAGFREDLDFLKAKDESIKNEILSCEASLKEFDERIASKNQEIEKMESEIARSLEERRKLQEAAKKQSMEEAAVAQERSNIQARLHKAQAAMEEHKAQQDKLRCLKKEIQDLKAARQDSLKTVQTVTQETLAKVAEYSKVLVDLAVVCAVFISLQFIRQEGYKQESRQLKQGINEGKLLGQKLEASIEEARQAIIIDEKAIEAARAEMEVQRNRIKELEIDSKQLKKQILSSKAKGASARKAIKKREGQIKQRQLKLQELQAAHEKNLTDLQEQHQAKLGKIQAEFDEEVGKRGRQISKEQQEAFEVSMKGFHQKKNILEKKITDLKSSEPTPEKKVRFEEPRSKEVGASKKAQVSPVKSVEKNRDAATPPPRQTRTKYALRRSHTQFF